MPCLADAFRQAKATMFYLVNPEGLIKKLNQYITAFDQSVLKDVSTLHLTHNNVNFNLKPYDNCHKYAFTVNLTPLSS